MGRILKKMKIKLVRLQLYKVEFIAVYILQGRKPGGGGSPSTTTTTTTLQDLLKEMETQRATESDPGLPERFGTSSLQLI